MVADARSSSGCSNASAYEHVRSHVLEGSVAGGHFGLIVLLRQGVAAWMAHPSTRPAAITNAMAPCVSASVVAVFDDVQADMIRVLASMVMTPEENRA